MKTISALFIAALLSGFAYADLPSSAQACDGPARAHNPHCPPPAVRPTVSVPEPGTLGILSLGLLGIALGRRLGG
jgi:hypothetical protein